MTDIIPESTDVQNLSLPRQLDSRDFEKLALTDLTAPIEKYRTEVLKEWKDFYKRERAVSNPMPTQFGDVEEDIISTIAETVVECSVVLGMNIHNLPKLEFYKSTQRYSPYWQPLAGAEHAALETKRLDVNGVLLMNMAYVYRVSNDFIESHEDGKDKLRRAVAHEMGHEYLRRNFPHLHQDTISANNDRVQGNKAAYKADFGENFVEKFAQDYVLHRQFVA